MLSGDHLFYVNDLNDLSCSELPNCRRAIGGANISQGAGALNKIGLQVGTRDTSQGARRVFAEHQQLWNTQPILSTLVINMC